MVDSLSTRIAVALFCLGATSSWALAHGGQYRGPWNSPPPITGGPGPGGPGPAAPNTGGRPAVSDGTSWQVWWEFSKDELLDNSAEVSPAPVSGSDEFYLGQRRFPATRDQQRPTDGDRRDRIAAALAAALRANDNRDIVTACCIGLAKVGLDPDGLKLRELLLPYVADSDQEVRETATLALGIAGKADATAALLALLRGDHDGRRLCGGLDKEVPVRTRTFAAWSLGLLAQRAVVPAEKRVIAEELARQLQVKDEPSRDLRVGLIEALGLLGAKESRSGSEKLLLWRVVDQLWRYYAQDLGKGDQLVQAHVPCAVARLLGRGDSAEHHRAKVLLAAELWADGRTNQIRQSAAMALGSLCLPPEVNAGDAEFAAELVRGYKKCTDQLTRFFCVLSLGRIGGAANRSALLSLYADANKSIERPWLAIALGVAARQRLLAEGVVDVDVGSMLLRDMAAIDRDQAAAAHALGIGLCGYREASRYLADLLRTHEGFDTLAGYFAVALGMLRCGEVADELVDLMQRAKRRPFVLQQCAVGLGLLGDTRTVPTLLQMLDESDSTATLAAIASALATMRDRRSIDPLIAVLRDAERTKLARAFAAAALGGVGDKDLLPWNAMIARDVNYMATVDTLTNGSTGILDIL